jgi:putative ABC transport system ATP-binding protein
MSAIIELQGVHKSYRLGQHLVRALRGVDLQVQAGRIAGADRPFG